MPAYAPEDLTQVDPSKPEDLDYWARTLEVEPEKLRRAVRKVGPVLEKVKKELGSYGV